MSKKYTGFLIITLLVSLIIQGNVFAMTNAKPRLNVAVWIPYWKVGDGTVEVMKHLDVTKEISPFAYYVNADGTLKNNLADDDETWQYLYDEAKAVNKNIQIIPSILWTDRAQMETILNNKKSRDAHIKAIVTEVVSKKYAGIDIDYENKSAETRVGFSAFLTDLATALRKNKKTLVCTIEPRTPVDSRYTTVTKELLARIEYSNDYVTIGKVCDTVRIMAYDQVAADVQLTKQYGNTYYRPVADIEWVKKVLTLTLRDIPAKKIYLGIATYGYKYEINTSVAGTIRYSRIGSMNFKYADELAKSLSITPIRHASDEVYFTYSTTTDINGKNLGSEKQYLVWYGDAFSVADKVRIAKLYKLGGVALFKIDGANDTTLWNVLK